MLFHYIYKNFYQLRLYYRYFIIDCHIDVNLWCQNVNATVKISTPIKLFVNSMSYKISLPV